MNSITSNHHFVEAVIVDLDGTMIDTLGDFVVALNLMLDDLPPPYQNHQVDRATVARLVGKGSEHLIKSVLAHVSRSPAAINSGANRLPDGASTIDEIEACNKPAWASYQRHYRAINGQHATVYPGVQAGLTHLKASGLKLACLTNKPTALALALLMAKGLDGFFDVTFGGDAFALKNPTRCCCAKPVKRWALRRNEP